MTPANAALLGLIEGLTEYLPISSTGHLILAGRLLGVEGETSKSFEIVIQLGAILAVVVHYRGLLGERLRGLMRGDADARRLLVALAAGFAPAAVTGVLLRKTIKLHLFGVVPVAAALIVGGVVMIVVDARLRRRAAVPGELETIGARRGLLIGIGQCFAMWPGASRSMCTIVAGQLTGLSTAAAAEFSFLLALPTLGAATLYELYHARHQLLDGGGALELAIGMAVSFAVAWAVIAAFLRYLQSRGLAPFGVYRIVLGAVVLLFMR